MKVEFVTTTANIVEEKYSFHKLLYDVNFKLFERPFDLTYNGKDSVYVTDRNINAIVKLNLENYDLKYIITEDQLRPFGIVNVKDKIYVVNNNNYIYCIDERGKTEFSFGGEKYFQRATFITVDSKTGQFYVSDSQKHKIVVFDESGFFLFSFGKPGNQNAEFASPQGLYVDKNSNLYVADMLNSRIQVFDSNGNFIRKLGMNCLEEFCLEKPKDIVALSNNTIYVTDQQSGQVKAFNKDGDFLFALGGRGGSEHLLDFTSPTGIEMTPDGKILVADQINARISIWQELTEDYLKKYPLRQQDEERLNKIANQYLLYD